jgi:hypothetical protein
MTVEKMKARSSGATPERDRKRDLVNRAGFRFRGYFITSGPARQLCTNGKAASL